MLAPIAVLVHADVAPPCAGDPPAGVSSVQHAAAASRGNATTAFPISRLRLAHFARKIQHRGEPDGRQHPRQRDGRRLVCRNRVPLALQNAPVRTARFFAGYAGYPGAPDHATHCSPRQASLGDYCSQRGLGRGEVPSRPIELPWGRYGLTIGPIVIHNAVVPLAVRDETTQRGDRQIVLLSFLGLLVGVAGKGASKRFSE
jgi:hypothetical protein